MNINDIKNHPQLTEAKHSVNLIDQGMIGRVALNEKHQATHILLIIRNLMGVECKKVLDIGTLWGGSIITMMQHKSPAYFVSIDMFNGFYKDLTGFDIDPTVGKTNTIELVTKNIEQYNQHGHKYKLVKGSSHDKKIIDEVHSLLSNSVDLLFIDGDHTKAGVIQDWNDYSGLVSKNGVVVFDDHWSGELSHHGWKNKSHWEEPERMDVVGAYKEISKTQNFIDNWEEIGLFLDKMIVKRK